MKIGPEMVIVCASDFSPSSTAALDAAVAAAHAFGAAGLRLLHVDETLVNVGLGAAWGLAAEAARFQREKRAQLDELAAERSRASGLRVTASFLEGQAWDEIVRYARAEAADLVVLGSHGRTGLTRALLGSVAERVVRHAHCSVLTVKPVALDPPT